MVFAQADFMKHPKTILLLAFLPVVSLGCEALDDEGDLEDVRQSAANFRIPDLARGEVFVGNFEHGPMELEARSPVDNLASPWISVFQAPGRATVVGASQVPDGAGSRAGNFVVRSQLRKNLNASRPPYRQEIVPRIKGGSKKNVDYWYGFSMYIPKNWQKDTLYENYAQWRTTTPGGHHPSLAIKGDARNPDRIRIRGGTNGRIIADYPVSEFRGRWTDFVIHARWSSGSDGKIEIFRNNDGVKTLEGPTLKAGLAAPIGRIGIYKGSWASKKFEGTPGFTATEKTIYYDEYRIAIGANRFNVVRPGQGSTPPPPEDDPPNDDPPGDDGASILGNGVVHGKRPIISWAANGEVVYGFKLRVGTADWPDRYGNSGNVASTTTSYTIASDLPLDGSDVIVSLDIATDPGWGTWIEADTKVFRSEP